MGYFVLHHSFVTSLLLTFSLKVCNANLPPTFTHDVNNLVVSENVAVGEVVYTLEGTDPENTTVHYGLSGTDRFKVNSTTGDIIVVKPLDHEINSTLNFFVTIEDEVESGRNNVVEAPVTVIVLDENDNAPVFTNVPYEVLVEEDTPVDTTVFSNILVTDADTVGNAIEVDCVDLPDYPSACSRFRVVTIESAQSSYHGSVILKEKLDFALQQKYQFLLSATDGELNTTTTMTINVGDIQNTPPVFIGVLQAEIDEDVPINTLVLTVHAKDGDQKLPRQIVYELVNNPMNYFLIDSTNGEIRTARPLDREAIDNPLGMLQLTVRARELVDNVKGNDSLTVTDAEVIVTLKDVNDEPPMFNKNEYHTEISEDAVYGYVLPNLNITVNDPDAGNNSVFSLSLDDISHTFSIEPEIVVGSSPVTIAVGNNTLDYEDPNQRKFIILIIAKEIYTEQQLSSTATITVTVTDANDNAPSFDMPSYSATVSEMAQPGTLVITIVAKDRDSGKFGEKGIVYQLTGNGSEKFALNNRTGTITVNICDNPGHAECLDYETKPEYYLSLKATDDDGKGQTSMVPLIIKLEDSNDNPPEFTQPTYNVFIDEGVAKFDDDLTIAASDQDKTSQIVYSIIAGNINNVFDIDPKTGKMKITNSKGLSFNNQADKNSIALTIEATDGKYTTSTVLNITVRDINNNAPVFEKSNYDVSIAENYEIGTSVLQVNATDADAGLNAELTYQITKGSFNDFEIDANTGIITVSSELDYDRRNTYNIEVTAADKGSPSLMGTSTITIHIVNVNNKAPFFVPTTQKAEIMKNTEIGTVVHTLMAMDPDVNSSEALNFAATEPITALDKYGKVVTGNDVYKHFFAIDKNTGKVTVANTLQRDVAAVITITVLVTDILAPTMQQGDGSLTITITDVNDHPPKFLPPWTPENPVYTLQVREELPVGTILATYSAIDEDSPIFGYYIKPESKYFEINNGTGILQIKERIDYEEIKSLNFTIIAYDSGVPQLNASAFIHVTVININDNIPIFSSEMYNASIPENSPNGTHIITVQATDLDADEYGVVSYGLIGQHSENFQISPETGEVVVANPMFLDHEILNETVVQVTASDGAPSNVKHIVSVPLYISILDVNDNPPKFNQSVYNVSVNENIQFNPPNPILQVAAIDEDVGANGNVHYKVISGNENDIFVLGEDTGILYVHKSLLVDTRHFVLKIKATDEGGIGKFMDKAVVHVHVLNVNEHKPEFIEPSSANSTIELTGKPLSDQLILTVKAIDNDSKESGKITYHFKVDGANVQETNQFTIDADKGEIKTKKFFNNKYKSKYQLLLVARDHGSPIWYETVVHLNVVIPNGDDGSLLPNIKHTNSYHFSVAENAVKNTLVGHIKVYLLNEDSASKVYYYVLSGNEDDAFYIDKLNGSLYTNKVLDREQKSEYNLLVHANSNPDYYFVPKDINKIPSYNKTQNDNLIKVKIEINDVNDNPPKFNKSIYYAAVNAMCSPNTFFGNISATDPDFGINGSIGYYVRASSLYKYESNESSGAVVPSPFNVTQHGELFTTTYLMENNQHRFIVDVVAKEVAHPERETTAIVYVWIFESEQLIRIILSKPREEVLQVKDDIMLELSNVTNYIVILNEIKNHIKDNGHENKQWCDMYILVVNPSTQIILPVHDFLKIIDAKYDFLKDYYAGFAIENVVPAFAMISEESFNPALSALIALVLVLVVGLITFIVVCCCLRRVIPSADMKKRDTLINKAVIDDLNTTENPLWVEQKLKIYEEQELSMQVFNEPEQAILDRRNSEDFITDENAYATIPHSNPSGRTNATTLSLVDDIADYATLSRFPPSLAPTNYEQAMGFQGSTFQVPESSVSD